MRRNLQPMEENLKPVLKSVPLVNRAIAKKSGALSGLATVPGDKSISHRALMFGAIASGETLISGLLEGEDVLATASAMTAMGAEILRDGRGVWRITGTAGKLNEPDCVLDMGNSGTSTRLLMGLVASYPMAATFTGDKSLIKRPMGRVIKPLGEMGATYAARSGNRLPLTSIGSDNTKAIEYTLPVASAQVKSAILLAGLNANGTTTVIEGHPTRDHSENMLRYFGAEVKTEDLPDGANAISIKGGQSLQGGLITVPRDPSSAAFPIVAAILNKGSEITCEHVGYSDTRNGLYLTLQEMGANLEIIKRRSEGGEPIVDMIARHSELKGIQVPERRVASMIDEFPILAVAASCANGTTTMTGLAELRVKESDRLAVMAEGLKACGVNLEMGEDSLTIHGTGKPPVGNAQIETHLDHRIAMSFLVLGTASEEPVIIDDASPIQTSFPGFMDLMTDLGANIGPCDSQA